MGKQLKLRQKVIFLAITPLILALSAIALAVWHQSIMLAQEQRATIQQAYLASKEAELKHYVALASHSIAHLSQSGRSDPATLEEAKRILSALSYGDDGYFFIYDLNGKSLMHPRLPALVGQNLWQMKDVDGNPTIQRLIRRAQAGGGFERYSWVKPSTGKSAPKLGYVVPMKEWGWIIGTGIYLDDVDNALAAVDAHQSANIEDTMLWIAAIAIFAALLVAGSGLVLNVSESREADAKLKVLMQRVVESQEEERARLARDLHDGISQWLVSIKLQIEACVIRLTGTPQQQAAAHAGFENMVGQLNKVLAEVRRISHNLRPAILDDLGLAAALDHLASECTQNGRVSVSFKLAGELPGLPEAVNTAFFRIAQEALTNIARHAAARRVKIRLRGTPHRATLIIADDGAGFDIDGVAVHPKRGIGLRNMMERMDAVGGTLQITSSAGGTVVRATVPSTK
jgi:two-component system NarL family sensor kinase